MKLGFRSRTLPRVTIKVNDNIKDAVETYRKWQVPMPLFLSNFLAVKTTKKDKNAAAENPWITLNRSLGHKVESGISIDETVFRFATLKLIHELPSDVITAAFYFNKSRNDFDYEIGYLLPGFIQTIAKEDNVLIVNPSPEMICNFESSNRTCKSKTYAVPDETVAKLYAIQFPNSMFISFSQLDSLSGIDALLIVNRDQKITEAGVLLSSLADCNNNAKVLGLIPTAWFDSTKTKAHLVLSKYGFSIKQALLLDPSTTNSTPRKKMLVVMEKSERSTIEVIRSSYDTKTRTFTILNQTAHVDESRYLDTDRTIVSCWKEALSPTEDNAQPTYKKPEEYEFSKEISLFYRIYSDRKKKFAGIAYYKEIKSIEPKAWGKKLTADIEKGLRAESKESVINSIGSLVFDSKVYPIIYSDIERAYIGNTAITLKTIWFYCWNSIANVQKYDHEFMCRFFMNSDAANFIPQTSSGEVIIYALAKTLEVEAEDIPYRYVDQIHFLLQTALKLKLITFNPLDSFLAEYSNRASERQQDVRNALVKKHFSAKEEQAIFLGIVGKQSPRKLLCTEKSLLLAPAIRLFTGISIREVAAFKWSDFTQIDGTDEYQFLITKYVDQKGKILLHSEKQNWKRFRIVPSPKVLTTILLARKQYLISLGIDDKYLSDCPIILGEERISDMKGLKTVAHCKPSVISKACNELIELAEIPENTIVLPDGKSDLATDFNRYHGDIFQTNFRDKANHNAFMTNGEINYILGVDAPDTFSRYYCDYTNDFVQLGMIQKLSRWELRYENIVAKKSNPQPSLGSQFGNIQIESGPYDNGVASIDLIIENHSDKEAEIVVKSIHGLDVNDTIYGESNGKYKNQR